MSNSLLIGNRFQVEDLSSDLIGQGGMGAVYRGVDLENNRPVAIKHLRPEIVATNPDHVERFAREGEALRQLNHPNIVTVMATLEEAGQHYLVMEYVAGGSLQELIDSRQKLPLEQVINIGLELADALTRAHHLHIIHRDIKPANVLLAEDGTPRLTDFGVAHMGDYSRITQAGTLTGTYAYLSPEGCNSMPLDARADIWSFGVLLFELLTGQHPFEEDNLGSTIAAILSKQTPDILALRPDAPQRLIELINQMLHKDRRMRISSVRLVGAELEAIIHEALSPEKMESGFRSRFATPTPGPAPVLRHNLPTQPTPFIGRSKELEEIAERLSNPDCRLLTLVGPGGIGKTRLALQAGAGEVRHYGHGVFFVALAPLSSAESLVPTIAEAIDFTFYRSDDPNFIGPSPRTQLLDHLREKQMLLLLDNFEHLLAGADLVSEILSIAPGVKVLVTSRERLNIQGEWTLSVQGMPFPADAQPDFPGQGAEAYSAIQLFLHHAQRVDASFRLSSETEPYIIRVCRLVNGMPLGIELAAAWLQMLSPQEIAQEIERSYEFLETRLRDVPERHRSLQAVFDYSWRLLAEPERVFLSKLSVFRGGFSREAATAVAADNRRAASLPLLSSLVNKSLLRRSDRGRYEVHELLRQFSAERLERFSNNGAQINEPVIRSEHSRFYLNFLQEQTEQLNGPQQQETLVAIEEEIENIRAAWHWAVKQEHNEQIADSLSALANLYHLRNWQQEGAELFGQALRMLNRSGTADSLLQGRLQVEEAGFCTVLGQLDKATDLLNDSLQRFRDLNAPQEEALTLGWLGGVASSRGKLDEAEARYLSSLEIYRRLDDQGSIANRLFQLGRIANEHGNYDKAVELYEEALAIRRRLGDRLGVVAALDQIGFIAYRQGHQTKVRQAAEEARLISEAYNNKPGIANAVRQLAMASSLDNDYEQAHAYYLEAMEIRRGIGNRGLILNSFINLSHISLKVNDFEAAKEYGLECRRIALEINNRWGLIYALNNLGLACTKLGQFEEARLHLTEALQIAQDMGAVPLALEILTGLSDVFIADGEKQKALRLLTLVINHPALIKDSEEFARPLLERLEEELPAEVVAQAHQEVDVQQLEEVISSILNR